MKLNEIRDNKGATHQRKVLGRGIGSGLGKTSGKGHKGQKARGVGKVRLGFEGGQNPLYRRLPKGGFKNPFKLNYFELNVGDISELVASKRINASDLINHDLLKQAGLIKGKYDGVRILGDGDLSVSINVEAHGFSASAKEKIEKAKGTVKLIERKKFVSVRKNPIK